MLSRKRNTRIQKCPPTQTQNQMSARAVKPPSKKKKHWLFKSAMSASGRIKVRSGPESGPESGGLRTKQ